MMKRSSSRISSEILLLLVLSLAMSTMSGCVAADVTDGVFAVRVENGVPTSIGEPAGIPIWSPVAYAVVWGTEDGLFLRAIDDSEWRQISAAPVTGVPGWSPEGTHVAYIDRDRASLIVVDVASGDEIFARPLDRRRSQNSRFPLLALGGPVWAPDGSRIAYVCWDGIGDEICLIRPDGTGWRQVTRIERPKTYGQNETQQSGLAASNTGPPAWSPDGAYLVAAVYPERPGAPTGVFLVDIDDGIGRRISSLQPNSVLTWSLDGRSIVFSAFRRGRSDVYRVVLANFTQERVTEELPEASRNPAISPDGSRIAVESGGRIIVLGPQGPSHTFEVPGLRSSYPSWSRDGTAIAMVGSSNPIISYD